MKLALPVLLAVACALFHALAAQNNLKGQRQMVVMVWVVCRLECKFSYVQGLEHLD